MFYPLTFGEFVDTTDSEQRWQIWNSTASTAGFNIPPYNNISWTNDGSGNPQVMTFSKNGTTVGTLTFSYDGNGYVNGVALS